MKNRMIDFTLTNKWDRRIKGWALNNKMPFEEALQEAYILEWELERKIHTDLKHRENYFLKSIKNKISSYGRSWWETDRIQSKLPELDIIDSLIEVRGFDELFYEYLINHVTFILAEIDVITAELFTIRITTQKRWNTIKKDYSHWGHHRFYNHVSTIKKVVKQEICKLYNE